MVALWPLDNPWLRPEDDQSMINASCEAKESVVEAHLSRKWWPTLGRQAKCQGRALRSRPALRTWMELPTWSYLPQRNSLLMILLHRRFSEQEPASIIRCALEGSSVWYISWGAPECRRQVGHRIAAVGQAQAGGHQRMEGALELAQGSSTHHFNITQESTCGMSASPMQIVQA